MLKYFTRRVLQLIPTIIGIYTITFFLMRILPGDAAKFLLGFHGTPEALASLRAAMHLDEPWLSQYISFILNTLRGDLGNSYITGEPITEMLGRAIPYTLQLATSAVFISVVISLPFGVLAALQKDRLFDNLARFVIVIGASVPTFWLGIELQVLFGLNLKILPVSGTGLDNHLILPSFALAVTTIARLTRMTRSSVLEELPQDYVRTARSKGLRPRQVVWGHALRNALMPIVTVWGLSLADLLTGALLVELIFGWPGLGRMLVQAISTRDYPLLQGNMILLAVVYAGVNLMVDMVYMFIDPRIRYD